MEIGTIEESEFEKKKGEILNEVETKKIEDRRRQELFDSEHRMLSMECSDGELPANLACFEIDSDINETVGRPMSRSIFACDDDAFEEQCHMDCIPSGGAGIEIYESSDVMEIQKEQRASSFVERIHGYFFGDYSYFGRNSKHFGDGPADLHEDTHHKVKVPINDPHDFV